MESKKPWESKTVWVALILALSAFYSPAAEWEKAHADIFAQIIAGVFFALRLVSKGKIDIKDEPALEAK